MLAFKPRTTNHIRNAWESKNVKITQKMPRGLTMQKIAYKMHLGLRYQKSHKKCIGAKNVEHSQNNAFGPKNQIRIALGPKNVENHIRNA